MCGIMLNYMKKSKTYALILAAGKGKRMVTNINKQFLDINGKPLLYYSLHAFSSSSLIDGIVLVASKEEIDYCRVNIIEKYNIKKVVCIVPGGKERQESAINGLSVLEDCNVVLIHDGARPFVNHRIIEEGIKYAELYGACACGVKPKDTIKIKEKDNFSHSTPDRDTLFCVQTPQCFRYDIIMECHRKVQQEGVTVTDDTMVVEKYGHKVFLYDGDYNNIKVTTPEDLIIADRIINRIDSMK